MRTTARLPLAAAVATLLLAAASPAPAAELLRGVGGPAGFGEVAMEPNDDGSSNEIRIHAAFPRGLRFFGQTFSAMFVNNNGNITFGGPVSTFTPQPFPVANQRMIAPYWADVDTRGVTAPHENRVYWHAAPGRVAVTWYRVGYFASAIDLRNDFQLVLIERTDRALGDFDVEFRYARCQWTTGGASGGTHGLGGTPAQAGFDAGDREHFATVPGSRTARILSVCEESNTGAPGLWRFEIRNGQVSICGNEHVEEQDEDCDDGNRRSGDGCSSQCRLEPDAGAYTLRQAAAAAERRGGAPVTPRDAAVEPAGPGTGTGAGGTGAVVVGVPATDASARPGASPPTPGARAPTAPRRRACAVDTTPGRTSNTTIVPLVIATLSTLIARRRRRRLA